MKKMTNRILAATADAALEALIASAGIPSMGGMNQPKMPKDLKKVAENRRKAQ